MKKLFERFEVDNKLEKHSVSIKKIPKGTILFSGNADIHNPNSTLPRNPFEYTGQTSKQKGTIVFFASEEKAAAGYAFCFQPGKSWINKFQTFNDLYLIDLNYAINADYFEVDEVSNACWPFARNHQLDGIFISYNNSYELALCNPIQKVKHVASKKCISSQKFGEWAVVTN